MSNPGSTACNFMNVRISSAAPITSTRARAISLTTRTERTLPLRKPTPERLLLSFKIAARFLREAVIAGTRPKKIPVSTEIASCEEKHVGVDGDRRAVIADAWDASGIDG